MHALAAAAAVGPMFVEAEFQRVDWVELALVVVARRRVSDAAAERSGRGGFAERAGRVGVLLGVPTTTARRDAVLARRQHSAASALRTSQSTWEQKQPVKFILLCATCVTLNWRNEL